MRPFGGVGAERGPWKMIGRGIDRRGAFFSFSFSFLPRPVMHYLHFLLAAAVTGVSLPASSGFERRHAAELTSQEAEERLRSATAETKSSSRRPS